MCELQHLPVLHAQLPLWGHDVWHWEHSHTRAGGGKTYPARGAEASISEPPWGISVCPPMICHTVKPPGLEGAAGICHQWVSPFLTEPSPPFLQVPPGRWSGWGNSCPCRDWPEARDLLGLGQLVAPVSSSFVLNFSTSSLVIFCFQILTEAFFSWFYQDFGVNLVKNLPCWRYWIIQGLTGAHLMVYVHESHLHRRWLM